ATLFLSWLNPHPIRSLCTLRIRRRRRLRNTRFPAARYHLTGAGLSPAGTRQLRLTHRNQKFESISLQRRVVQTIGSARKAFSDRDSEFESGAQTIGSSTVEPESVRVKAPPGTSGVQTFSGRHINVGLDGIVEMSEGDALCLIPPGLEHTRRHLSA